MNARLNVDRFKAARIARAKGLAGASTLLHDLLERTRAASTLSDLASRWKRSSSTRASDFTRGLAPTAGADLSSPDALRDFLDRIGQIGSARALDGTAVPTRAPAALPEGAQFLEKAYSNAAGRRPYKLYVPSCYEGQPLPLIVMLHGCTQSPDDFAAGTRMNALAEEHACLVAYPGQTPSANSSKCWNWFSPQDQRRDQGEPSLIAGITRQIMSDYAVDSRRVYIAGLSAGGAAASIMGAEYPDLYAAVGVHSGLACGSAHDVPSAFAAMRQGGPASEGWRRDLSREPMPTIIFHGDRDKTVHPINGDQVAVHSRAGAKTSTSVRRGQSSGGIGYSCTVHADASDNPVLGTLGSPRRRSRVVRGQPRRIVHRAARSRRQPRDAALLSEAPKASRPTRFSKRRSYSTPNPTTAQPSAGRKTGSLAPSHI